MASPQPIICQLLKLPPERYVFFRIAEIPEVFLQRLSHLDLALAAYQEEKQSLPEVTKLLANLHRAAGQQCTEIFGVIALADRFSHRFITILEMLQESSVDEHVLSAMQYESLVAASTADEMEGSQRQMMKFENELGLAVLRVTTPPGGGEPLLFGAPPTEPNPFPDHDNGAKEFFNSENTQAMEDLARVAEECSRLLHQTVTYYREMHKFLLDIKSVKSSPPTADELGIMQERWTSFSKDIVDAGSNLSTVRSQRIEDAPPSWTEPLKNSSSVPLNPLYTSPLSTKPKAILDAPTSASPDPEPTTPLPTDPVETPTPRLSFFRRILSCISIRNFF
ncbi:hypothetical protein P691DRAFT_778162 [Macrolepiota fuliginosa MF-IS2]|uniref:Uncharacterized protein n=1 Tax=Macrolepiota fuliginosa MF-IS2 TaxID=1400762 RepID=A0A9P6C0P6_9AGAR|nr:hypothetical protein P691DRAFT_778162 [Macrolepiota fuliginosa MF-IS2]